METLEANESVKHVLEKQASQQKAKKLKVHTHFTEPRLADMQEYPFSMALQGEIPGSGRKYSMSF